MKKLILYFMFIFFCLNSYGQKEDYNWFLGDYSVQDSLTKNLFQFNGNGLENIDTVETDANFYITNSSISDSLGDLLFYTNGRKIYNAQHQVIENGDSLNYTTWGWNLGQSQNNYSANQGTLILKKPESKTEWYLFHLRKDTISSSQFPNDWSVISGLLVSKISYDQFGTLQIETKNELVVNDTMFSGNLTACRHGNGRDWWVVASEGKSNCIYKILLTPDTLQIIDTTCAGMEAPIYGDVGHGRFSPDGSKYIKASALKGIDIFDFDRCNGFLTHLESIPRELLFDTIQDPSFYYIGYISISPNSKYLYTTTADSTFRFNLLSNDIYSTKELVRAIPFDSLNIYTLSNMELASDGKIYFSNSITKKYHVMDFSDMDNISLIGLKTNLPLQKNGGRGLPNFPNYRLGALIGSPCDSLRDTTISIINRTELQESLNLFPNPSTNLIRIEYGNFHWSSKDALSLTITNYLGQEVFNAALPLYSLYQDYDISEYPPGIYFVNLYNQGSLVGVRRLVKE